MQWNKLGLVYKTSTNLSWANHGSMTPTPILMNEETIRVYYGGRDKKGISRISYVDLDANDPTRIIKINNNPVIDLGEEGMFDDNGMILGDVISNKNELWMYYVGFQLVEKVKFLAFTGLAISTDHGESFKRYSETPILDRSKEGKFIRAIHSVIPCNDHWKIWYAVSNQWAWINNKSYPSYYICCTESKDGIHFPSQGKPCIQLIGNEYRIGRPRVYYFNDIYHMFYTKGCLKQSYLPGYANSQDGIHWNRTDNAVGIAPSQNNNWDSQTLCYPALIKVKNKIYMFYNGNNFGELGFGCAILVDNL